MILALLVGAKVEVNGDISGNGTPPVTGEALKVATKTYQHLMKEQHFTSAGASGALAVGQRESNFDPKAINPAGGVAGLFQWSGWGSFINGNRIHAEGSIKGMDLSTLTLDNELKLLDYELNGSYSKVKDLLSKSKDPVQAAKDWSLYYEGVSLSDGQSKIEMIAQLANQWYAYFNGAASSGGSIKLLDDVLGKTVGSGQCYALSNYYAHAISGLTLHGLNASDIGSDNKAQLEAAGWKVIFNPSANQLVAGSIVNWGAGSVAGSMSTNPYGHTGIISSVKGTKFVTYEQNVGGVQIVQSMTRNWDESITSICIPPKK
ncbi:phage tail tip lysozyme [Lactococcus muris]|uniref:Phage tail tip lysozyme n=2 Tax=Lactococcus TaxID=1357 RepID=A0ABV4D9H5_9LACT